MRQAACLASAECHSFFWHWQFQEGLGWVALPRAALRVLCCVLVAGKVLVTHWCFGSHQAAPHSIQAVSPIFPLHRPVLWAWPRAWRGHRQTLQLNQANQGNSLYNVVCLEIKLRERRRGGNNNY